MIIIKHPLRIWQQVELVARQHQQHRCPPAAVGLGLLLPHRQTRSKWPKNTIYYQPPSRRSSFSTAIGSPRDQGLYYSSSEAHGAERLSSPTCSCQFTSATWSYSISIWGRHPTPPPRLLPRVCVELRFGLRRFTSKQPNPLIHSWIYQKQDQTWRSAGSFSCLFLLRRSLWRCKV